jgi:hypothetical protein
MCWLVLSLNRTKLVDLMCCLVDVLVGGKVSLGAILRKDGSFNYGRFCHKVYTKT